MCPPLQYLQILSGKGPSFTFFSDSVPLSTEPAVVAKLLPCGFKQCGDSFILPSLLAASSFCHMPTYVAYLSAGIVFLSLTCSKECIKAWYWRRLPSKIYLDKYLDISSRQGRKTLLSYYNRGQFILPFHNWFYMTLLIVYVLSKISGQKSLGRGRYVPSHYAPRWYEHWGPPDGSVKCYLSLFVLALYLWFVSQYDVYSHAHPHLRMQMHQCQYLKFKFFLPFWYRIPSNLRNIQFCHHRWYYICLKL